MSIPRDTQLAKIRNLRELSIVTVKWEDSASMGRWRSFQNLREEGKPVECESVGYLAANTAKKITLVQSVNVEGDCTDTISIPKKCINRMSTLRDGSKRKKHKRWVVKQ